MRRCLSGAASALKAKNAQAFFARQQSTTVTLFPGDGIGPEIADSVKKIYSAAGVSINWDEQIVGTTADPRTNSMVTRENLDSVLVSFDQSAELTAGHRRPCIRIKFHAAETQNWSERPNGHTNWERSQIAQPDTAQRAAAVRKCAALLQHPGIQNQI